MQPVPVYKTTAASRGVLSGFISVISCRHRVWALTLSLFCSLMASVARADEPLTTLAREIRDIDRRSPGELGVYLRHLGTGEVLKHKADRAWYLSSTVKVPVAIAVLQAAEENRLSLSDQVVLRESHYVDGSGDLLWHPPGRAYTLRTLLEKSVEHSDSTATDMLIGQLGVAELNRRIRGSMVATGFEPFTTILQVRYDAYAELHPRAEELSNMDFIEIKSAGSGNARVRAFQRKLGLAGHQLRVESLEQAFERYYQRNLNSGTLAAYGLLLERLVHGELLNDEHTGQLLRHMKRITTGDRRLKAGLPKNTAFAQKTGTQIERACNVGVVHPGSAEAVVIAACMEKFGGIGRAERVFKQVAAALERAGWL